MGNGITSFFVKEGRSEENAIIASGRTLWYHNMKHDLVATTLTATQNQVVTSSRIP
jgi:hypothetical protein